MSIYKELDYVVKKMKPKKFLEIGVRYGLNLAAVDCSYKVGIDPAPKVKANFPHKIYKGFSDAVFKDNEFRKNESFFDLIFIDGLHEFRQIVRDVKNALKILTPSGMIVCHDVFPFDFINSYPDITNKKYLDPGKPWCGDVWKLILYVRYCMPQLDFYTVNNFPGYLYLWNNDVPRDDEKLIINGNKINAFSIKTGIESIPLMHVVTLEELWKHREA